MFIACLILSIKVSKSSFVSLAAAEKCPPPPTASHIIYIFASRPLALSLYKLLFSNLPTTNEAILPFTLKTSLDAIDITSFEYSWSE
ncbi:hypothetical protein NWE60_01895 [Mycoplasmopsis felis]|nr:hypothetical protein [Mycoplasmopsis felis]WAM01372.1 hypothetical protein NWE60_01895 [Mycoplasmopsis felis]